MITVEVEKTSYILANTVDLVHIRMQQISSEKQRKNCKFYYHLRKNSVRIQVFWNSTPCLLITVTDVSKDRSASHLHGYETLPGL
jgi:hypothetical protein